MDDNNLNVTEFDNYCQPRNNLVDAKPYFILLPGQGEMSTIDDIQTSLNFIRKHNILLSIFSTGHSYIGRSSGKYNNSFQINFKNHKNIGYTYSNNTNNNLMLNSSYLVSVTVETGVNFEQLYSAINKINLVDSNKYNYLITGGECHTVGVGGYYLGGGHSPLSPYLGLGIDSVYEYKLIISNGSYITANLDENNDLFWALRGGGGSSFGIVLNITINVTKELKNDEWNGITSIDLYYPFNLLKDLMIQYFNVCIPQWSNRVTGYFYITKVAIDVDNYVSIIEFVLLYVGNINDARKELNCMKLFKQNMQLNKGKNNYTQYNTFWEWESQSQQSGSYQNEIGFSVLYSQTNLTNNDWLNNYISDTKNYFNSFENLKSNENGAALGMCHTLLGHNVTSNNNYNFSMTSITPGFRQARIIAESYVFFQNTKNDSIDNSYYDTMYNKFLNKFRLKYQSYTLGSYFNENYWNNSDYADDYWSLNHYEKLQSIKRKWDPIPSLFDCSQCVDSL